MASPPWLHYEVTYLTSLWRHPLDLIMTSPTWPHYDVTHLTSLWRHQNALNSGSFGGGPIWRHLLDLIMTSPLDLIMTSPKCTKLGVIWSSSIVPCLGHSWRHVPLFILSRSQLTSPNCTKLGVKLVHCALLLYTSVLSQSCLDIHTGVERPPQHVHILSMFILMIGSYLSLRTVAIDSIIYKDHYYLWIIVILSAMPQGL